MKKDTVTHIVLGLGKGGAETMLFQILKHRTNNAPEYKVISLGLTHYYEDMIRELGTPLIEISISKNPISLFKAIIRIKSEIRDCKLLCCWMYGANLIGYLVKRRGQKIIWCIRHSDLSSKNNSKKTIIINKICAKLSNKISLVAYNGVNAQLAHEACGYKPQESIVLNNGLDINEYKTDPEDGLRIRKQLGIGDDKRIILSVARDSKIKDLPAFIKMLSLVKKHNPNTVGVMCGIGIEDTNDLLRNLCKKTGLQIGSDIYLIGFREDIPSVMNMADVFVLHSRGEAFPNTLIQAMACEIPLVTTDVGDVKEILNSDEFVVNSGDYRAMAKKVESLLKMGENDAQIIKKRNRIIIEEQYNIDSVVKDYEKVFGS